jgi:hypothetical protein
MKVYKKIDSNTEMDATTIDPHHNGYNEWGILEGQLYIRAKSFPIPRWNLVKRVSYTPKRIIAIAEMIKKIK